MSEHTDESIDPSPPVATTGVVAVVVAFFVTITGLFVLPLNTYSFQGSNIGFVEIRSFATLVASRPDNPAFQPFSTLGAFWWRFGALIIVGVLAVLVIISITASDRRPFGWVVTVLAVIGGALHGLALAQTTDLRSGGQVLVGYAQTNIYNHAGIGVWVSLAGFGLLVVAGVVLALLGAPRHPRRETYSGSPDDADVSAEPA